jgi:hypothetical protein
VGEGHEEEACTVGKEGKDLEGNWLITATSIPCHQKAAQLLRAAAEIFRSPTQLLFATQVLWQRPSRSCCAAIASAARRLALDANTAGPVLCACEVCWFIFVDQFSGSAYVRNIGFHVVHILVHLVCR